MVHQGNDLDTTVECLSPTPRVLLVYISHRKILCGYALKYNPFCRMILCRYISVRLGCRVVWAWLLINHNDNLDQAKYILCPGTYCDILSRQTLIHRLILSCLVRCSRDFGAPGSRSKGNAFWRRLVYSYLFANNAVNKVDRLLGLAGEGLIHDP